MQIMGVIILDIRTRTAALVMAAVTFGAGFSVLPDTAVQQFAVTASAQGESSLKAPTAKSSYTSTEKDITISWDKVSGASGYYVYRWSKNMPAWVRIGTSTAMASSFTDKKIDPEYSYKYYVVAYKKSGGKRIMGGRSNEISATAKPPKTAITYASSDTNYISIYWNTVKCGGYEVYYKKANGEWKLASKITDPEKNSCDIKGLELETKYAVKIRTYKTDADGKIVYSDYSDELSVMTAPDFAFRRSSQYLIDRLDSVKLNPGQNTYYECNRQGDTESKQLITVSAADTATIKRFVDAHFRDGVTTGEFIDYTVQWLNKNVSYADGIHGPAYSEIWGRSHVDNCFNYKAGQCIQYNSALCAVMRYLGYDARVIQGWRGNSLDNKWQHFWCEVTINGKDYVMDTYNYGTDGDWYFVCATYEETAPYAYNSHYIMLKKLMAPFKGYVYVTKSSAKRK